MDSSTSAPARMPVAILHARKRPDETKSAQERATWSAFYAGAAAANRWEPEFTLLTEAEFDAAIAAAGQVELGGQRFDGTHPSQDPE